MKDLIKIIGFCFLVGGIYVLGQDIIFTSRSTLYWWTGVAADASVISLMAGVLILVFFPKGAKSLGWIGVTVGIILVFLSSRVVLNPVSLWNFFLSFLLIASGYKMMTTGRLPF
jgi:hypothetical protein